MSRTLTAAIAGLAAVAALAFAPAAFAKDGDVRVQGRCTGAATAKLKLSEEDGRIEVEFEVDQNRDGVRWQVVLKRNGTAFFSGSRVTRAPSGSFEVRRLTADGPGTDVVTARSVARRPASSSPGRGSSLARLIDRRDSMREAARVPPPGQ